MDKPITGICVICKKRPEGHHIKTRGSGGSDADENMLSLCREHHQEVHRIGLTTFVRKYHLETNMVHRGFYLCEITNKWKMPRK